MVLIEVGYIERLIFNRLNLKVYLLFEWRCLVFVGYEFGFCGGSRG